MNVAELEVALSLRMSQYERDMMSAQKRVEDLEKTADKASKGAADKIERNLTRAAQTARTIGRTLSLNVTAPIAGVIGGVAKIEMAFDESMHNVNSLAKLSAEGLDELSASVLKLADDSRIRQTPEDLAQGLYDIQSSGFSGAQALDNLKWSAYGASAGLTDTLTATKVLDSVLKSEIGGVHSAKEAMDVLFQEVNLGKNTFGDLASQLGDVLPTAKNMGVSLQEVSAGLVEMTLRGISTAESVTSLNTMMLHIAKPGDEARKAMEALGISYGAVALQGKGLNGWLKDVIEKTHGNKQALLEIMPEVRAFRGLAVLAGDGGRGWSEALQGIGDAAKGAGAATEALDEQNKSQKAQWDEAVKQVHLAAIGFTKELAPAVKDIAKDVRGLSKFFQGLNDDQKTVTVKAALVAAAIGPTVGGVAWSIRQVLGLRSAVKGWGGGTAEAIKDAGTAATDAAGEVGGLRAALMALTENVWVVRFAPVAVVAAAMKMMDWMGQDFLKGIPEAQAADRDALHSAKQNEEFRVGQAWPVVLAKSAGDIRKATEEMVKRFGSSPSEIAASDVRGYVREIVSRGDRNLTNSMHGPITPKGSKNAGAGTGGGKGDLDPFRIGGGGVELTDKKGNLVKDVDLLNLQIAKGRALRASEELTYNLSHGHVEKGLEDLTKRKIALLAMIETQDAAKESADKLRDQLKKLAEIDIDIWKTKFKAKYGQDVPEWKEKDLKIQKGLIDKDQIGKETVLMLALKASQSAEALKQAAKVRHESALWYVGQIREIDAQILTARGGLSDLNRVSLGKYGKKYGEIAGGKGDDGRDLTKQQRQQLVLKDLEKERADKAKDTVDWIKEQTLSLQREIDTAILLTETEKVRYEIQQKRAEGKKISPEDEKKMLGLAGQQDAAKWRDQLTGFGDTLAANIQGAVDATTANKQGVKDRLAGSLQEQSMRLLETGDAADRTKAKLIQLAESMGYGETQAQKIATGMDAAKVAMDAMLKTDKVVAWRQQVEDATRSVEDAFMQMASGVVDKGFGGILSGFEQMLGQIAKEQLLQTIRSSVFGSGTSSGGGGSNWLTSLFGGIFGGGGSHAKADLYKDVGTISGYMASGGPVLAGHMYRVNEDGPEMLVPSRNGTVIPADETRDILSRRGGGGQVVNVTVNAADAGSFVQSKRQIAGQVARELSAARGRR